MPNGTPTCPFVLNVTFPYTDCIEGLNAKIQEYWDLGYECMQVIPCPGKNWPGASMYHWLLVFKSRTPAP